MLSERLAADLGARPVTTALLVARATIGTDAEDRLNEALAGARGGLGIVVERGPEDALGLVLLLLGGLGAVLVLGGTLTATLLALSEARPDFGTLLAIGATPGIRRATAAAYAAAVGLAGALLGALAGLIPGIAIAFPLSPGAGRPAGRAARRVRRRPVAPAGRARRRRARAGGRRGRALHALAAADDGAARLALLGEALDRVEPRIPATGQAGHPAGGLVEPLGRTV